MSVWPRIYFQFARRALTRPLDPPLLVSWFDRNIGATLELGGVNAALAGVPLGLLDRRGIVAALLEKDDHRKDSDHCRGISSRQLIAINTVLEAD